MLRNNIHENVDTFIHEKIIRYFIDAILFELSIRSVRVIRNSMQNVTFEVSTTTTSYYHILFRTSLLSKYL